MSVTLHRIVLLAVAIVLFSIGDLFAAKQAGSGERFTAIAVNTGGSPGPTGAQMVEIVIDRWSTASETDRLLKVLQEQGPEKLLDALHAVPRLGYIRTPDSIGYELHFATRTPGEDGGEDIVIATDRFISFWEAVNRPRTINYPFTVIQMRMKPGGQGEGKLSIAAKLAVDRKRRTIILEDYGTQPVLLNNVQRQARQR